MAKTMGIIASSYTVVATTETQLRMLGNAPNPWLSTPDASAIEPGMDCDYSWFGKIDATSVPPQAFMTKQGSVAADRTFVFRRGASQLALELLYCVDGVNSLSSGVTYGLTPFGYFMGVRFTRRGSDGLTRIYRSNGDPPTWVKIGEFTLGAGSALWNGGANLIIGGQVNNGSLGLTGYFRRAEVRNGFDGAGSIIASPDVRALSTSTTTFNDAQSNTWTYNGNAGGLVTQSIPATVSAPICQAVRFSASTMRYSRTPTGLTAGSDFTWCCWMKIVVDTNAVARALAIDNTGASYYRLGTQSDGTTLLLDTNSTSQGNSLNATVGTWYFVASTYSASGSDYYYDAVAGATTLTQSSAGTTAAPIVTGNFYIGYDGFAAAFNGSVACVRLWQAALTKTELEAEMQKVEVQRTANLFAHYSFRYGPQASDESGNARSLTISGTPVLDTSGPPVSS